MGGKATGSVHGIHDVDVGTHGVPNIHHGHGQVLLVHIHVDAILHGALDVLQRAGEHHAGMRLQDGQVDDVIGFQQEPGQLDPLDVGAVAADRDIDQILVAFDVDQLDPLLPGHLSNAADLKALHGVAADGGGLGDDDLAGFGLLHLADDGAHHLGVGADRRLGGSGMAGIGFEHNAVPFVDQSGDAAQQVKDLGHALLNGVLFRQSHRGLSVFHLISSYCSV